MFGTATICRYGRELWRSSAGAAAASSAASTAQHAKCDEPCGVAPPLGNTREPNDRVARAVGMLAAVAGT
jgi:hypothetical protein